jgi:molybdopterin molybdotransferase
MLRGHVGDDPEAVAQGLTEAVADADVVLTSGGVSVGRHDHIRGAIERLGRLDFWRIAMQPGKPLAVGVVNGRTVVGLPGNPVSALVVTDLLVRPLIRATLGLTGDGRLHVRAVLDEDLRKDPERTAYLRVRVRHTDAGWAARPAGGQLSSQLRALAAANGLLVVPEGEPAGRAGHAYETILLGEPDPAEYR